MEMNESVVLLNHILKSQVNLEIALDVAYAYQEVRRQLIVDFVQSLEAFMMQKLDSPADWTVENTLRDRPFDLNSGFFVAKRAWGDNYKIGLEAQKGNAHAFVLGVKKGMEGRPQVENLYLQLNTIRNGKMSLWWDWYCRLEAPYADWDIKPALIAMYNKDAALKDLGEPLLRVTREAAGLIDKHLLGGGRQPA